MSEVLQESGEPFDRPKWWKPLWKVAVHVWIGTLIFLLIYTPAIGLNLVVKWLVHLDIDQFVVKAVEYAEYTLVFADSILFLTFVCKTTWRGVKEL